MPTSKTGAFPPTGGALPVCSLSETVTPTIALPPALNKTRLTSSEASAYLAVAHGVKRSSKTLDRLRCTGGGPEFERLDRSVYYRPAALDAWVLGKLSGPVGSTSAADVQGEG